MILNSGQDHDQYEDIFDVGSGNGDFSLGWYWDSADSRTRETRGFLRFPSVNIPKGSVNYAGVFLWTKYHAEDFDFFDNIPSPSGTWNFTIRGINEDNTAPFTSNPYPRPQTSSSSGSNNSNEPDKNTYKEINVTTAVSAVMSRSGWNSGNAIGLVFEMKDSGVAKFMTDGGDKSSFMLIRKSAEPNFKPTPKTVAAPTFPDSDDYGMKISYPGYDVLTCTDEQTYFTTKKRYLKILYQGKVNTQANVVYTINHNQSVKPIAQAWFKSTSSNKRYKMPRFTPGDYQDPDSNNTDARIEVDATQVRFMTTDACEVYYYIYINELAS